MLGLLTALSLLAPAPASATGRARAHPADVTNRDSMVRAGYSSDIGGITWVEADWTEPVLDCSVTPDARSNVAIALQDAGHHDIISIGTSANCVSGTARYKSWLSYPDTGRQPGREPVEAGEQMHAIAYLSGFAGNAVLNNYSWSFNGSYAPFPAAAVEVRVGGLTGGGTSAALSDFGSLYVTDSFVNHDPMSTGALIDWRLVDGDHAPRAVTSGLHPDGSFAVNWRAP